ncbi:BURP domain-containing protein 3-like [Wolffia australiana]
MAQSIYTVAILMMAVIGVSAGSLPPQNYWHSVLPHTPIPSALRQRFQSDDGATVGTSQGVVVNVGTPGVGVGVAVGTPGTGTIVNVYPFIYQYAATKTQVHDNVGSALFFLEKDLLPGSKMTVHFGKTTPNVAFLPRSVANSLPFSSSKFSEVLSRLSLKSNSKEAAIISQTLKTCEEKPVKGETKYCATSLESMVDFATASLGSRDLHAISTEVSKPNSPKQAYVIEQSGVEKVSDSKAVACHAEPYAYAVYYCHASHATKSYLVKLSGTDGTKAEAVVVCHNDTSSWNPKHIAFQLLKIRPGTVPVCHFLPTDHVVWAVDA